MSVVPYDSDCVYEGEETAEVGLRNPGALPWAWEPGREFVLVLWAALEEEEEEESSEAGGIFLEKKSRVDHSVPPSFNR